MGSRRTSCRWSDPTQWLSDNSHMGVSREITIYVYLYIYVYVYVLSFEVGGSGDRWPIVLSLLKLWFLASSQELGARLSRA